MLCRPSCCARIGRGICTRRMDAACVALKGLFRPCSYGISMWGSVVTKKSPHFEGKVRGLISAPLLSTGGGWLGQQSRRLLDSFRHEDARVFCHAANYTAFLVVRHHVYGLVTGNIARFSVPCVRCWQCLECLNQTARNLFNRCMV